MTNALAIGFIQLIAAVGTGVCVSLHTDAWLLGTAAFLAVYAVMPPTIEVRDARR